MRSQAHFFHPLPNSQCKKLTPGARDQKCWGPNCPFPVLLLEMKVYICRCKLRSPDATTTPTQHFICHKKQSTGSLHNSGTGLLEILTGDEVICKKKEVEGVPESDWLYLKQSVRNSSLSRYDWNQQRFWW